MPELQVWVWAWKLWRTRATQALLSVLGVVSGVGGLVLVLAVGAGAQQEMRSALGALGSGTVILQADNHGALDAARLARIGALLPELVEQSTGVAYRQAEVGAGESHPGRARLVGVDSQYASMFSLRLHSGRFVTPYDVVHRSPVCVVGARLGRALFPRRQVLGQVVQYGASWCRVVGVLADNRTRLPDLEGVGVSASDYLLYLPVTTIVGSGSAYALDEITVRFSDEAHLGAGLDSLRRIVERQRAEGEIRVVVPVEVLRQKHRLQQVFQYLLLGATFVLLVVGGTGIMNNMMLNVLSRRAEIGLRRALGATRADIIAQFVSEAMVIAVAGGLAGIILGALSAMLLGWVSDWQTQFSLAAGAAGFAVSLLVGIVFGSYPALQAAAVSPVRSLHEL
ncbi:ABC transporter permease [Mangrovimicrobium sediminis]|uniref:ABC transporter permease n=1 Tax=Mangrovimicrobium sediminis TaxID=2562682 RepID=UPI001436ADAB|nr:ABC transporter permease [Haliea sp. SAOS-164]